MALDHSNTPQGVPPKGPEDTVPSFQLTVSVEGIVVRSAEELADWIGRALVAGNA